jgi:hypothetical protein
VRILGFVAQSNSFVRTPFLYSYFCSLLDCSLRLDCSLSLFIDWLSSDFGWCRLPGLPFIIEFRYYSYGSFTGLVVLVN